MLQRLHLILILVLALGCSNPKRQTSQKPEDYQTLENEASHNADHARALNLQALELLDQRKYAEAEKTLKQALAEDVGFGPAHNNLGKVYYHQQKLYLAAWEFEYGAKLMPKQPEPKNNLGMVFEAAGKLDEAIKAYDEAVKLEPENVLFVANLARARIKKGEKGEEVRRLLEKIVMKDPRPEWVSWAKEKLALMPKQ